MKALVIMAGTTGAGKTTHGKILAERLNAHYISSGDIARSMMDSNTDLEFKEGKLSPHEDAIRAEIKGRIESNDLVILDGFPRLRDQLGWLASTFPTIDNYIVQLEWPEHVLVSRWMGRHRDEYDDLKTCIARHDLYHKETQPMWKEPRFLGVYTEEKDVVEVSKTIHVFVMDWLKSIGWEVDMIKSTRKLLIDKFIHDHHIAKWEPGRRQTTWATTPEEIEKRIWEIVNV